MREYARFSGDLATARELSPSLIRVLHWLLRHSDPATARPFHDYFTDNGVEERGQMLARPRALAAQLRAAAAQPLYERHRTLPPPRDPPCWHEHFLATLAGEDNREELRAVLADPRALRPRSGNMWFWAVEAMFRAGLAAEAMRTLRRMWGLLVELGLQTCPETLYEDAKDYFRPGSPLSYCHGWSAGPNYLLVRETL